MKKMLILGAGASVPYGYPTGDELLKKIIKSIDEDEIYFPIEVGQTTSIYSLELFKTNILKLGTTEDLILQSVNHIVGINQDEYLYSKSNPRYICVKIHLSQIRELEDLRDCLIKLAPPSIDKFLNDHPNHQKAGKCMIIYELLKSEYVAEFSIYNNDHWYKHLVDDLVTGYKNHHDFLENVTIVTFNYDMSLECFLKEQISNKEIFSDDEKLMFLEKLKILHVYGSVHGPNPYQYQYGAFISGEEGTEQTRYNFLRFDRSLLLMDNIKTMHEEHKSQKLGLHSLTQCSLELVFIGYGFHSSNNAILGLPIGHKAMRGNPFFAGKTIKYYNFDGEGTYPDNEFSKIENNCTGISTGGMTVSVSLMPCYGENGIASVYTQKLRPFR